MSKLRVMLGGGTPASEVAGRNSSRVSSPSARISRLPCVVGPHDLLQHCERRLVDPLGVREVQQEHREALRRRGAVPLVNGVGDAEEDEAFETADAAGGAGLGEVLLVFPVADHRTAHRLQRGVLSRMDGMWL